MTDPRLAWFAMGATFSAVLFGWPWRPRYSRMQDPDWRRSVDDRQRRWFINNPAQIAECGGPCSAGPSHCDCGALWLDVPKGSYGLRLDPGLVQHPACITFPDPDPSRRPTNAYTGEPVQPNPPPSRP